MLLSCAEENRDFVYGQYEHKQYFEGEQVEFGDDRVFYDGTVFNDTLYLTRSSFSFFNYDKYRVQSCAPDTSYYAKSVYAIPLSKKYNKFIYRNKYVGTHHYKNGENVDTCIRVNFKSINKFSVTEDYIELVECNDGTEDCKPIEAVVTHFIRPRTSK